ncbi:amidohydrolase [Zobellia galactanivorans]|uniref:amidohydrolase n=1 Tax=Zobellia galactanivorans (strain DSM 12802 / CCUG 47099 / CIP 106680 / NCIMB 13871 / Dsij) TaxID=63186 RepID=UPI001C06AEFC|nr:amidohydrolase [Zobellia galactanivorans]MBU3027872.1 amidohydrolase [Zobellia galactanivorans]MDO6810810.1 amidohydrolase [Zobellia galactanivorans]
MKNILLLVCLCLLAFQPAKDKVDLIVVNANVYTVDSGFTKAEAFAVQNGKFIAVGTSAEIQAKYTSDNIVNAQGKTITPGLIDAHCHFFGLGRKQQVVDLTGTKSYNEVLERVKAFQESQPKDFILGSGWDQNDWEVKEFPTKEKLDALFPDTPVALVRIDGHALLVNQKALDRAGIGVDTKVEGGEIVKQDGKLTGVLVDNPMDMVYAVIPGGDRASQTKALKDAERICLDYGLTTVNDAGLDRSTIELIDSLHQTGDLSIRVYAMVGAWESNLEYYLKRKPYKTERLNVRSVKVYGDGALGSRGAALREPYSDMPGHFGAMVTPVSQIEDLAQSIAKTDFQMNTHAIGDSANVVVLRAYEKALKGQKNRRWKVEHAQIISPENFDYFKNGIIPSVQPTHATSDMYWAKDRIGEEREKGAYAYKTLLDKAGTIALGTDFPVEQVNPLLTFYAAVARKDLEDYPKGGYRIKEALTREETLKGMTLWAAYSNFEEDEKGSVEVGKFADFVVYSDNLMEVPIEKVPEIKVEQTFVNGKRLH